MEYKTPAKTSPKQKSEAYQKVSSTDQSKGRSPPQRAGTGRVFKPKSEIQPKDYKGFTKSREFSNSNSKSDQIISKTHKTDAVQDRKNNENKVENLERDMNQINIQDNSLKTSNKQQSGHRQNVVPPRLQVEQKGSKRYSSLRQRSLPETAAPSYNQAANYYPNEYATTTPTAQPQSLLSQPSSLHASAPQVPQIPPPPLAPLPQPVSVTPNPILQAPPPFAATFPQAAAPFLPPTVGTPPFIAQQPPPPLINYVQSQAQFPQAAPYQGYQQFNAVNQAELYQCQGGTTYYSTQNQQLGQRMVPQKRPKAAIPIVAPPIPEPRGRGRSTVRRESPPLLDDTVCETVISENNINYEDSIVYVQQ
ncbi:hypothetical protein RI129_003206 [Pyrocoelia pectoralis]|uniref:Uncharacterized protein n=1 Tax=Pyrocoelia pectoralis TaxID=417401 RepID=A0AAN7VQN0_9COLE